MILGDGQLATAIRANVPEVDWCWIAWDTPVDANGDADTEWVLEQARPYLRALAFETLVVISSQVRVGTCARLEAEFPGLWFAVVPENIRVATGAADFKAQDRIVFGSRRFSKFGPVLKVLDEFSEQILFVRPESAELAKHALNGYLALCITYANEIADLCERYGADGEEVATALLTERRVSSEAPLHPGAPYGGGHLGREVNTLVNLGGGPLITGMMMSNAAHR